MADLNKCMWTIPPKQAAGVGCLYTIVYEAVDEKFDEVLHAEWADFLALRLSFQTTRNARTATDTCGRT